MKSLNSRNLAYCPYDVEGTDEQPYVNAEDYGEVYLEAFNRITANDAPTRASVSINYLNTYYSFLWNMTNFVRTAKRWRKYVTTFGVNAFLG
jgi:hypothetical protein